MAIAVAIAVSCMVTALVTPLAIRLARRTDFFDVPREYRKHKTPTPFLGGTVVLAGFSASAIAIGGTTGRLLVVVGCAVGLWLLGTVDDRIAVAPKWRLLSEIGAAVAMFVSGLGWKTSAGGLVDLLVTTVWIVGLVNAFNLMDNLDGACASVGGISAAGIGVLAVIHGQSTLAGLAFALVGACAVFLCWNLAEPAKIFLGDGGSMPVGFLVAALAVATLRRLNAGDANILSGALLAGLPILDTALVSVSRRRRGVTLLTGGRDHLTHRLLLALRSPRAVAATLALAQAMLCALAIVGDHFGVAVLGGLAVGAVSLGVLAIAILDTARWRPPGIALRQRNPVRPRTSAPQVGADSGRSALSLPANE